MGLNLSSGNRRRAIRIFFFDCRGGSGSYKYHDCMRNYINSHFGMEGRPQGIGRGTLEESSVAAANYRIAAATGIYARYKFQAGLAKAVAASRQRAF